MDVEEVLKETRSTLGADRVFGAPVERDGVTVVPVAKVAGGGGGGADASDEGGAGAGFGLAARPAGALVIDEAGSVDWRPMIDVNKVVLGFQAVVVAAIAAVCLVARSRVKAEARRAIATAAIDRTARGHG